jgi:hypothetical protein
VSRAGVRRPVALGAGARGGRRSAVRRAGAPAERGAAGRRPSGARRGGPARRPAERGSAGRAGAQRSALGGVGRRPADRGEGSRRPAELIRSHLEHHHVPISGGTARSGSGCGRVHAFRRHLEHPGGSNSQRKPFRTAARSSIGTSGCSSGGGTRFQGPWSPHDSCGRRRPRTGRRIHEAFAPYLRTAEEATRRRGTDRHGRQA